jgi:hypothetical protein
MKAELEGLLVRKIESGQSLTTTYKRMGYFKVSTELGSGWAGAAFERQLDGLTLGDKLSKLGFGDLEVVKLV